MHTPGHHPPHPISPHAGLLHPIQGAAYCTGRGEIVEDVAPPLPLDTKMLLVKPPVGLATPRIFKALDLGRRSTAEPRQLLADMGKGEVSQALVVNDLEQPAFDMWVVDCWLTVTDLTVCLRSAISLYRWVGMCGGTVPVWLLACVANGTWNPVPEGGVHMPVQWHCGSRLL